MQDKNNSKMQGSQKKIKFYDQYKKIFCAYHKTQFLTNFCTHESCLMPLCPSCIVDHTQDHYKESSKPEYMNLHEALHQTKQKCVSDIRDLELYANRLKDISEFKKKLVQQVHNQLNEHKHNLYVHIERMFLQFEQQVYNVVVTDYEQEGLYKQDQINEYSFKIQDTINQLYDKIGSIKGDQCLAALIMYFGQEKQRFGQTRSACRNFIQKHQLSKVDTLLDEAAMKKQIEGLFENIIEIKKVTQTAKTPRKYLAAQRRTPQKNKSLSQSRRSRIFQNNSGSKYGSMTSPNSNKIEKEKSARLEVNYI